jgi:hypothetical protein
MFTDMAQLNHINALSVKIALVAAYNGVRHVAQGRDGASFGSLDAKRLKKVVKDYETSFNHYYAGEVSQVAGSLEVVNPQSAYVYSSRLLDARVAMKMGVPTEDFAECLRKKVREIAGLPRLDMKDSYL